MYNPKYNEKSYEYRKNNLKRVGVDFNIDYFNETLKPVVEKSGMTMGGYIKAAIEEKIARDE